MEKLKELYHKHPVGVAVGAFLVGLIVIWYLFHGSSAAPASANAGVPDNSAADAAAEQAAAQESASEYSTEAQLSAAAGQNQTQISLAQEQVQANQDTILGQVASTEIAASTGLAGLENTNALTATQYSDQLQATLAGVAATTTANQLSAQVAQAQIGANAWTANSLIGANAWTANSELADNTFTTTQLSNNATAVENTLATGLVNTHNL